MISVYSSSGLQMMMMVTALLAGTVLNAVMKPRVESTGLFAKNAGHVDIV